MGERSIEALDSIIEQMATELFKAMRAEGQELALMAHMVVVDSTKPSGLDHLVFMPAPKCDKHDFTQQLREQAKEKGGVWVALISEAWVTTIPNDGDEDPPKRTEVLTLSVESAVSEAKSRHIIWPIVDGQLGEREEHSQVVGGAMTGLLPEPETTQLN
jgi:hypothetical protein